MSIVKTHFAYESIKEFLRISGRDPLIESFCVQFLVVRLYSEMEDALASIIRQRLDGLGDPKIAAFVTATNDNMIRRVKKAEINDVLKKFGCDDLIEGFIGEHNLQPYFDAIQNRHLVTHGDGCNMTLEEFAKVLPCADLILAKVAQSIAP